MPFIWDFIRSQYVRLSFTPQNLEGRIVVVTGANTGLGLATAKHLATMNPSKIVLACRDMGRAAKAVNDIKQSTKYQDVEAWDLDLASFASVRAFAKRYQESGLDLHILINNAGIGATKGGLVMTDDGCETILQVNHLGTMLLTLLLLPVLQKTAEKTDWNPRIVVLSSGVHSWSRLPEREEENIILALNDIAKSDPLGRYPTTKLLNILFVQELSRRLSASSVAANRKIVVHAVNPGLVTTELARNAGWRFKLHLFFLRLFLARSPKEGAKTSVYVAIDPQAGLEGGANGRYFSNCGPSGVSELASGQEGEALGERLWKDSIGVISSNETEFTL